MISLSSKIRSAIKCDRPTLAHLQAMDAQFALLQEVLASIQQLRNALNSNPAWDHECETRFEEVTNWLMERMQATSFAAAEAKATSLADLSIKARIWLERYVPESDNDVIALASSICSDVLVLYPRNNVDVNP